MCRAGLSTSTASLTVRFSIVTCLTVSCEGWACEQPELAQSPDLFQLHGRVQLCMSQLFTKTQNTKHVTGSTLLVRVGDAMHFQST